MGESMLLLAVRANVPMKYCAMVNACLSAC